MRGCRLAVWGLGASAMARQWPGLTLAPSLNVRRRLRLLCAGLAVICGLLHAGGEAQAANPPPLHFEPVASLNAEASLAFLQDRQGFIWVGTNTGLYRHDGYRSLHYQHDKSIADSLPDDKISALFEDKHGRIWIGSRNGIARFEARTGRFTRFSPRPAADGDQQNLLTRGLVGDGQDGLWLATRGGLLHFDPESGRFASYRNDPERADSLPGDNVAALARDAKGGLWVGTWPSGLAYLAKGSEQFQRYALDNAKLPLKSPSNPRALHVDSRQRLWIGTDNGVLLWHGGTPWASLARLPSPPGVGGFRVFSIGEDGEGNIWIGTLEAGLLRWDETQRRFLDYTHRIDDAHSLPANAVSALLVDRTQTLWVGTHGGGVSRSDLVSSGIERVMPDLLAPENFKAWNIVFSFAEDGRGNLWLGGTGGLALVNLAERKLLRSLRHKPGQAGGLSSNAISHLYQQPGGALWIATSDGLGRLDPDSGSLQTKYFAGPGNNSINRIAPGRNGVLWLATGGGVIRYSTSSGAAEYYSHDSASPDSLGPGSNSCLVEDRGGNLWVGGGQEAGARGLAILEKGGSHFRHYRHNPEGKASLSSDIITSIHEDGQGNIWLGTAAGLNRAIRAADGRISFKRYMTANNISSVQADKANNIWSSTLTGLSRLDPKTGEAVSYANAEETAKSTPIEGAGFRSQDGSLYFGSTQGFTVVKPLAIQQNINPPQVAITDISVFNQSLLNRPASSDIKLEGSVTEPQHLRLSWKASVFSLEFSALHYADPSHNRFAYRLDGFDQDWVESSAVQRVATYTNLDPGEYVFRVKAASNNGVWGESELSLPITITPPYWNSAPFRITLLIIVLLLAVFIYNWRVRQLILNQAHLEALVEERTRQLVVKERAKTRFLASASHDLRQPIQAITLFLGALKRSGLKETQNTIVGHLDASVEALRGLLNALLDVSKLDAGAITPLCQPFSLNRLMETLTLELSPLALDKNLRFKLFCPHREIALDTDQQLLTVALRNLMANAITYTDHGGLLFSARLRGEDKKSVSIQIWDTGIGISESEQARIFDEFYQIGNPHRDRTKGLGLGLAIVKRTLVLLKLTIRCHSRPGRGTVFEILAPTTRMVPPIHGVSAANKPVDLTLFAGKRFIVVDDDLQAADGMCSWLQSIGGEVLAYSSAESALADTTNIYAGDYYISDFRLPGKLNGIDFLKCIRARSKAPGVLVTGDTSSEFIEMTHRCGIPALFKPIVPDKLLRALSD
ncbi:two-component regulator propeller domain-containing protein [Propionivibrio sp.]|uniref:two-component regulator propeller domain-containing protein n=1 Tax=Propionivibrio sp. TaxID=2212460 RepID=UPI003BF2B957